MTKIVIEFCDKKDIEKVAFLSKKFEEENCCNGIIADDIEYFLNQKVIVAKIENNIVGYCYGTMQTKTKNTTFYANGQKGFYIEEIFVDKDFRNINIGQMLYNFAENYAKSMGCDFIEVTAVSKDYKKLLKFYIEKLNMTFWSAHLIKKI